jgi:23S rRNA pseudouridine1911/1915/1917 synthase
LPNHNQIEHSDPRNLQVLFEDNHLIVVNKRAGDIVQGDKTGDLPLSEVVKQYIKTAYDKPGDVFLGVVHRLDRPTSGVLVFGRTSKALTRLNALFAAKETRKIYWAMVKSHPGKESDTLVHWLVRNPKKNKSYAYLHKREGAKYAEMDYRLLRQLDRYYLLEVGLKTGRHHQIRAQLASIGCPVKGDLKYGYPRSNPDGGIHLHSRELSFVHPVRKEAMTFIAEPPQDPLWNAIRG